MPTLLIYRNVMFIIHTRDRGFPHVTVYQGTPETFEAMAKIRLDRVKILESRGFSAKSLKLLLALTEQNQADWLEEWNGIFR